MSVDDQLEPLSDDELETLEKEYDKKLESLSDDEKKMLEKKDPAMCARLHKRMEGAKKLAEEKARVEVVAESVTVKMVAMLFLSYLTFGLDCPCFSLLSLYYHKDLNLYRAKNCPVSKCLINQGFCLVRA